jgi:hypothetical protein
VASVLSDVELSALAGAVRLGLALIEERRYDGNEYAWNRLMTRRREAGRWAIENGRIIHAAQSFSFGRDGTAELGMNIAALAMLPGGVRIDEIVFCARHYPGGKDARFRLSCPQCSPDDHKPGESRDVVAVEGIF